jgi:hypothetical protein
VEQENKMSKTRNISIRGIATEEEIQEWLNITNDQLKDLRNKYNFPFVSITTKKRFYWLDDVRNWIKLKRTNIPVTD